HHVCQPIQRVILILDVGAGRVIDVGQVSYIVITVTRVTLGFAPTVGQPAVGIVLVTQDFHTDLIDLVGDAPILVVVPLGRMAFAIRQTQQIPGGTVGVADDFRVGVGFSNF